MAGCKGVGGLAGFNARGEEVKLIGIGVYLGIGAMLHALFVGAHFDWSSSWTLGWLFGWPVMIFIWFWVFLLGAFVVGVAIALAVWAWDSTWVWRTKRSAQAYARATAIKNRKAKS